MGFCSFIREFYATVFSCEQTLLFVSAGMAPFSISCGQFEYLGKHFISASEGQLCWVEYP